MMIRTILQAVWSSATDWLNPVRQNPEAMMYDTYKGVVVRLVPVFNGPRIERWVPDPEMVKAIDAATPQPQPPSLPGDAQQQTQPQPPSLPGDAATTPDGFNPAGVDGL